MKVYACYVYTPYEGCTSPILVTKSEEKAKTWCKENKDDYTEARYKKMELE